MKLQQWLDHLKASQAQGAETLGVSETNMSRWLKEERLYGRIHSIDGANLYRMVTRSHGLIDANDVLCPSRRKRAA